MHAGQVIFTLTGLCAGLGLTLLVTAFAFMRMSPAARVLGFMAAAALYGYALSLVIGAARIQL